MAEQLPDGAYRSIRNSIITGVLNPGQAVSEYDLAARLKMSRTPIRVALARLEGDGLVERSPGRGYFVTQISSRQIREIYEAREALESFACREAGNRIDRKQLTKLAVLFNYFQELATPLTPLGWRLLYEGGVHLHRLLVSALENRTMVSWFEDLEVHILRVMGIARSEIEQHSASTSQHLAITEALLAAQWDEAAELLTKHLRYGRAFLLEVIASNHAHGWAFADNRESPLVASWMRAADISPENVTELLNSSLHPGQPQVDEHATL